MNWESIQQRLASGTIIDGRYVVDIVTDKAIIITKSSGKQCSISRKMCEKVSQRLDDGETLAKQANGPQGGISYTVCISATVAFALSLELNSESRWHRSSN